MLELTTCEDCGTTLSREALLGLCPKCLAGSVLEVAPESAVMTPLTEQPGDRIGHFKLLQKLGEGGCGAVYLAAQEEPVQREVALKIIKLGMDTRQVIARFEAERQVLALMDHPNIAKVFDAGATETGRPYFVMELVRGTHLTRYCHERELSIEERLGLFVQICLAIQHAHQKGVIHRDIKPSNILVALQDGVATPKVIDFGIAKATQQPSGEHTLTQLHQFLGTPAYMSPEQATSGKLDIDTRSDIYALGVLLYELLTGTSPFNDRELRAAGFEEMCRTIREVEPIKPSTRVAKELGAQSKIKIPKSKIGNDLDWIVMKALEKDRVRRYDSAASLAADIQRYLDDQPVLACPPTTFYQVRKFARRHRAALATVGGICLTLLLGIIVSTWMAFRARAAEREQLVLREQAKAARAAVLKGQIVANFLKSVFEAIGPATAEGRDTSLIREVMDRSVERVEKELQADPQLGAEVRRQIGVAYDQLHLYAEAETMLREALRLFRELPAPDLPQTALTLGDLASVLHMRGKLEESRALYQEALEALGKAFGDESKERAACLDNFASLLTSLGDYTQAEASARQALALRRKLTGEVSEEVQSSLRNLALILQFRNASAEAETCGRQALEISRKLHKADHLDLADSIYASAVSRMGRGDLDEAEKLFDEELAMRRRLSTNASPDIARTLIGFSRVRKLRQDLPAAESLLREALAVRRQFYREPHQEIAWLLDELGEVSFLRGDMPNAEKFFLEALAMHRKLYPGMNVETANTLRNLANTRHTAGDYPGAESLFREALAMGRVVWTNNPARVEQTTIGLADALFRQSKFTEAAPFCSELRSNEVNHVPSEGDDSLKRALNVAKLFSKWAYAQREATDKSEALACAREAVRLFRESLKLRAASPRPNSTQFLEAQDRLASGLIAEAAVDSSLDSEGRLSRFTEAEELLLASVQRLSPTGKEAVALRATYEWLVNLYEAWETAIPNCGKAGEAAHWRQTLSDFDQARAAANAASSTPKPEPQASSK